MRKILLGWMLALLLFACQAETPVPTETPIPPEVPPAEPAWILVWADEFELPDGATPDLKTWNYSTGGHGWGNNELQYYSDRIENAFRR